MIQVLQNWNEIGIATKSLAAQNLPRHTTAEKTWDLYQLHPFLQSLPTTARVIDLGCSGASTLKFLHALGFQNIYGIDLNITILDRLIQLSRMWKNRTFKPPFRLRRADLTKTPYPDQHFDLAICLSVIEHGVDLPRFFAESARILKPGALLFITTDYWQDKITPTHTVKEFNLPWNVFSKTEIENLLTLAAQHGFSLYEQSPIPPCSEKCVVWNGLEFSFICLVLKKKQETPS